MEGGNYWRSMMHAKGEGQSGDINFPDRKWGLTNGRNYSRVVSCFRKRVRFSVFSSQNKWLLCSRKVEIVAMPLHVRARIGRKTAIYKDVMYSSNTPYNGCRLCAATLKNSAYCPFD